MAFITEFDLKNTYNDTPLTKLLTITNDISIRVKKAVARIKSYIQHRYNPDYIFYDVLDFSTTTTYAIGALIQYTESAWDLLTTYAIDARVSYLGKIYKSILDTNLNKIPTAETLYWEFVCDDNLYFSAIAASTGNYPEDTDFWLEGDLRDPSIVDIACWLTLYDLFSGGNPRTNPEIIQLRYEDAIKDLKAYGNGDRTIILTVNVDEDGEQEGDRITFDSQEQKNWNM